MPPRKPVPGHTSARSHDLAQDDTRSHAVQSDSSAVGFNDPVTISRASASPRSDATALTVESSIRSLHLEVLSEIFILAMHTDCADVHPKSPMPSEGKSRRRMLNPFFLCAVCSSWRSLAFSTPALWRKVLVHMPFGMSTDQADRRAADLVQWIKRSRSGPLTLYIFCPVSVPLNGTGPEASIISVFTDYATRWEAMYLQPTPIHGRQSVPQRSSMFCFDGWRSLRRLCSVDPYRLFAKAETIPWAQLTHLQIHHLTPSDVISILEKCSKLVQLSMTIWPGSRPMTTNPIVMHNLVSLSLGSRPLSQVLDALHLPSLRDMYISNNSMSRELASLLDLFTRSSCSLDKLEISVSVFKPGDLLHLLAHRSCNSLTSLKIDEFWSTPNILVDNKVLQRLTLDRDDSLCPHLRFLTVDCSTKYSVPTLLKMLESRIFSSDGQAPLQYLHFRAEHPEYKLDRLDKFGERSGMRYDRRRHNVNRGYGQSHSYYLISFRREDLSRTQLQASHGGFCFDRD